MTDQHEHPRVLGSYGPEAAALVGAALDACPACLSHWGHQVITGDTRTVPRLVHAAWVACRRVGIDPRERDYFTRGAWRVAFYWDHYAAGATIIDAMTLTERAIVLDSALVAWLAATRETPSSG